MALKLHKNYFRTIFTKDALDTLIWDGRGGRIEGFDEKGVRFAFLFNVDGNLVELSTTEPVYTNVPYPILLDGCTEALFTKLGC